MSNHTPGPWMIQSRDNDLLFDVVDSRTESKLIAGPFRHELPTVKGNSETIANARLIAAAPELLEALETIVCWQDVDSIGARLTSAQMLTQARAAIAKAKGEAV